MIGRARSIMFLSFAIAFRAITWGQPALAADLERAIATFESVLPSGWIIAERKSNEYPWGHHFCDDYRGPTGTKITATGPAAVSVQWVTRAGVSLTTPIAKESLEIWFMPPMYKDSAAAWLCSNRPIQPIAITTDSRTNVFARPSHRINSEDEFRREVLDQAQMVSWPESPENDRSKISWHTWQRDIAAAIEKEFAR